MKIRSLIFIQILFPALVFADVPAGYSKVAREYSIPEILLYSVALQESEKPGTGRPWPWTINVGGKGIYFDSRTELFKYAEKLIERGITNFDIGLMQVNWRWNGQHFRSLWAATEPYTNLRTGAMIIRKYYRESRSYEVAIGKYHAPSNPENAKKYKELVRNKLALLVDGER